MPTVLLAPTRSHAATPKPDGLRGALAALGDAMRRHRRTIQALQWAVEGLAKAGTLAIIGVYPPTMRSFPIGQAMNKEASAAKIQAVAWTVLWVNRSTRVPGKRLPLLEFCSILESLT